MKINAQRIPADGIEVQEKISSRDLDFHAAVFSLHDPISVKAHVYKITNALSVDLSYQGSVLATCSRCLKEYAVPLQKNLQLSFQVSKADPLIDLDPVIREEIILDFPIKPLCDAQCKGLCPVCGKDLNEGLCTCQKK